MSTSNDTKRLSARQINALAGLASGLTDARAAELAHTTPSTIAKWRKLPAFVAELDNLLRFQRDRVQGLLGVLAQESETVIRDALGAVGDDGKAPAHGTRLRAAEAALSTYERISKRASEMQAPPLGPLIVLPVGTRRMALAVDTGPGPAGSLPAGPAVDVTPPVELAPVAVTLEPPAPEGLPRWWKAPGRSIR